MKARRRMTDAEFNHVLPLLKISSARITAAYQVLVKGEKLQVVGNQFGCSRQAVHDTVNVVWRTFENHGLLDINHSEIQEDGFVRVSAVLTRFQAFQVNKWDAENKKKLASKTNDKKE